MIFLAVMALSTTFINFTVPLLIGARDVAFPSIYGFVLEYHHKPSGHEVRPPS